MAYWPSGFPNAFASKSIDFSPNALLSIISMSTSAFFCCGDSCVRVTIFWACALASTGTIDWASFGTTSDAINQGVNALLVVPNDAQSIVPVLAKAQAQKIVTLTHESPQQKNADVDIEMIDNTAFGEKSIDLLAKAMGKPEGQYAIYVGSLTVPAHNIWADAALARAKQMYPDLKPIGDRYPVSEDQSAAHQTALDILTAHPDLKGFLCFGSQGAPGAAQAVGEKGLIGKVAVIGTTSPNQAAQYLTDGSMSASILWDPAEAAYAMVYMAKLTLDGKKAMIGPDLDIPTLGKPLAVKGNTLIYDRPLIVTKDNLDKYNTF